MSFQGLGIILCGLRLRSLDLWLQTCVHSSFFLKGSNMCLQLTFLISLFPACTSLGA